MKPGAVFSGSVAFMEPYHYLSRFHLSADAVVDVLDSAGLRGDALDRRDRDAALAWAGLVIAQLSPPCRTRRLLP